MVAAPAWRFLSPPASPRPHLGDRQRACKLRFIFAVLNCPRGLRQGRNGLRIHRHGQPADGAARADPGGKLGAEPALARAAPDRRAGALAEARARRRRALRDRRAHHRRPPRRFPLSRRRQLLHRHQPHRDDRALPAAAARSRSAGQRKRLRRRSACWAAAIVLSTGASTLGRFLYSCARRIADEARARAGARRRAGPTSRSRSPSRWAKAGRRWTA